jgi:hypothetical protein
MLKQQQTVFGDKKGNCFATCIACILELPVEEVPNFCGDHWTDDGEWFRQTNKWLAPLGLRYIEFQYGDWVTHYHGVPDVDVIVSGPGPRGCDHAVIWRAGELVHDPHPSGDGLLKAEFVGFFVDLHPARTRRAG